MVTRTKKVFVGGLSAPTTIDDVKNYFQQFGRVSFFFTFRFIILAPLVRCRVYPFFFDSILDSHFFFATEIAKCFCFNFIQFCCCCCFFIFNHFNNFKSRKIEWKKNWDSACFSLYIFIIQFHLLLASGPHKCNNNMADVLNHPQKAYSIAISYRIFFLFLFCWMFQCLKILNN